MLLLTLPTVEDKWLLAWYSASYHIAMLVPHTELGLSCFS
jgi:hypothetical protein